MFDVGWSEIALVAVLSLVIIGPKDLPKVLRTLGRWVRRLRLLGAEMQRHMEDIMRETGADEVRDHVRSVTPAGLARKLDETIDPDGSLSETFRQRPADLLRPPVSTAPPAPVPAPAGDETGRAVSERPVSGRPGAEAAASGPPTASEPPSGGVLLSKTGPEAGLRLP